jgi:hypothetical protein
MKRHLSWTGSLLACALIMPAWADGVAGSAQEVFGPKVDETPLQHKTFESRVVRDNRAITRLRHWNEIATDANALDHTPVQPDEQRVFGEQVGPGRTARALAIVHIAMFDAINAIVGGYQSYTGVARAAPGTSINAAIAQAAHDTLVALYPSQKPKFDALLAEDLGRIQNSSSKTRGIRLGADAAALILALKTHDGSAHAEARYGMDFIPSDDPGKWRLDPIAQQGVALGVEWGKVAPFVIPTAEQFRIPPPPALNSQRYADAFNEVKRLGGDGITTPTERTRDQTIAGIYWGYDGVPGLGTPPRLYNQIAVQIARQRGSDVVATARLLALVNVGMADAGIASWESKYLYQLWRPIGGLREADEGTGPTGLGDGNPDTLGDPNFTPLGAPASNLNGPDFTPPFPAYPSGHATFGGVLFQILRTFYGTNRIPFVFVSDEFNGRTRDNDGSVRPLIPRYFSRLSQAEEENGQSRIYLGVHWEFDKTEGIRMGRNIANYVFNNSFQRIGAGHLAEDLERALESE